MPMPPISNPADPASGDKLPLADLNGALLLITVNGETEPIETKFGPNTAIQADVAVLDGPHKAELFVGTLIFPRVLKGQLRGAIGGKVLGRLGQGVDKKGNPPWVLSTPTNEERATGEKYLAHVALQQPVAAVAAKAPWEDEEPF